MTEESPQDLDRGKDEMEAFIRFIEEVLPKLPKSFDDPLVETQYDAALSDHARKVLEYWKFFAGSGVVDREDNLSDEEREKLDDMRRLMYLLFEEGHLNPEDEAETIIDDLIALSREGE